MHEGSQDRDGSKRLMRRRRMRPTARLRAAALVLCLGCSGVGRAAAPAPPSYLEVQQSIEAIRQSWSRPENQRQPNRPGWDALFDALLADLNAYGAADNDASRLESLDQ